MNKLFFYIFLSLIIGFILSLTVGGAGFGFSVDEKVLLQFRLPKAITAMLAGSALAVSGLVMQALFRNPLADPFVLGINAGGSLGAALVVLAGFGQIFGVVGGAWVGSACSMLLILAAARRVSGAGSLLIVGVMIGYLASALISVLLHASRAENVQGYVAWSFGSFAGVGWDRLVILAPVIFAGVGASFFLTKPLNAMLLGENAARSLGVNVNFVRNCAILLTAVLSGTITAFCGPVAFVGLAVPHLCRALSKSGDHARLLPLCVVAGAALALFAEVATAFGTGGSVLPLNAVLSLVGAPLVVHALVSGRISK